MLFEWVKIRMKESEKKQVNCIRKLFIIIIRNFNLINYFKKIHYNIFLHKKNFIYIFILHIILFLKVKIKNECK